MCPTGHQGMNAAAALRGPSSEERAWVDGVVSQLNS